MSSAAGLQIFRLRDFRRFVTGRFLTGIAQQIQTIGVGLYVYETTRDPLALGLAGLFTFLPQFILVAHAGHVADRYDRRLVSALCYGVNAVSAIGLLVLVLAGVHATTPVYAMIVLIGLARVFGMPANQAMLPNLVPEEERSSAIAWHSSANQIATIAGPAIGGFLYLAGPDIVFGLAAVLHIAAALAMASVKPQKPAAGPESFSWSAFTDGITFIRSRPALFGAISLDLAAVLFGGVVALLPIFATDILEAGPQGFGWLRTSAAVGSLGMALYLSQRPIQRHTGYWMLGSVAVFGVSIIGFGLSRTLWLSLLFMLISGAADMVSVVVRTSIIQNDTPDVMRGRVSSVSTLFIGASNSLGDFESGLAAGLFGTVPATLLGGAFSIITTLLWTRLFPELTRRDVLMAAEEKPVIFPAR